MPEGHEHLFLVGFMGTGKSTVGRGAAARLGLRFVDSDSRIENTAGITIPALFAVRGEAGFRALEKQTLLSLLDEPRQVVATGGGMVLDPDNVRLMRAHGLVICLLADIRTLWRRVSAEGGAAKRPLLAGGLPALTDLFKQRLPFYYAAAHVVIDTSGRDPAALAEAVAAEYLRYRPVVKVYKENSHDEYPFPPG